MYCTLSELHRKSIDWTQILVKFTKKLCCPNKYRTSCKFYWSFFCVYTSWLLNYSPHVFAPCYWFYQWFVTRHQKMSQNYNLKEIENSKKASNYLESKSFLRIQSIWVTCKGDILYKNGLGGVCLCNMISWRSCNAVRPDKGVTSHFSVNNLNRR